MLALLCALCSALAAPAQNAALGNLPLYFEANRGQSDAPAQFLARSREGVFRLSASEASVTLARNPARTGSKKSVDRTRWQTVQTTSLRFQFLGANPNAPISGVAPLRGKVNYLLGDNPAAWQKNVPTFTRVQVDELYPGIQLAYYGNGRQLEYDFVVAPGADPGVIAFRVSGADRLQVDAQGDLLITAGSEVLREQRPVLYQLSNGQRASIAGGYRLLNANTVGFTVGAYDRSLPLVIDPVLTYSSFLGGQGGDVGRSLAVDGGNNIYITGDTLSGQLATTNALQSSFLSGYPNGGGDAFVAKFDPTGTNLVYLTYLGGNGDDVATAVAVDSAGNAYLTGVTDSTNFPTLLAISNHIAGIPQFLLGFHPYDAFVTKLDASGNLVYSTYLGGNDTDEALGIAVDSAGNAYVTGFTQSTNFPTFHPLQATRNGFANAFVTAIDSTGTNFLYSTYLGGVNIDHAEDIAVDGQGRAYITGFTSSTNFPATPNAFQPFQSTSPTASSSVTSNAFQPFRTGYRGRTTDAFVSMLATDGSSLVASTFLGGVGPDLGYRLTLDSNTNVYVTGGQSGAGFPITPGPLNPGGVFVTGDGADNWAPSNAGLIHNQVYALALDTNSGSPLKLYAVTGRGISVSTDGGATWAISLNTLAQYVSIAIDPSTPTTVYAAGDGVLKSLDGGTTWMTNNAGLTRYPINKLLIDPSTPATLYAASEGAGLFKSTDGANSWKPATRGLPSRVRDLAFDPSNSATLYAATPGGVYRTDDAGNQWRSYSKGLTNHLARALAADPFTPGTVYVGTAHGNVFKSLDFGTNWFPVNAGLSSSNSVTALAIDPSTPTTLYAGTTNGLFRSLDAGTNWSVATNGLSFADIASLAINPAAPANIYAGIYGIDNFGGLDAFVTKLSPDLSSVIYSVALGGNALDQGSDVAVDASGNAFVIGTTYSTNFPTANTVGFLSSTNAGSTNLLNHSSSKTPPPLTSDAFVAAINPDASAFLYSAYLGGGSNDLGLSIALDTGGNAILLGQTLSPGFPTLNAQQPALYGTSDAFLARIQTAGSSNSVTVQTDTPGLAFTVDGLTYTSAFTTNWPTGSFHSVSTATLQTNGVPYAWVAWSDGGAPSHTVIVTSDATLTASFSTNVVNPGPLAAAKGTYTGLFFNTNTDALAMDSSGLFNATVGNNGSFSAQLHLVQRTVSFSGQFAPNGSYSNIVARGSAQRRLQILLQLDLNGGNTIAGQVTDGDWVANLLANRSVFTATNPAPQAGKKYTLLLPGGAESIGQPGGDSFGTVTVSSPGTVRFTATLADGTHVSQSTFLSQNGEWPLFIPLYRNQRFGLLIGTLNFTNAPTTDIDGFVDWFKLAQAVGQIIPTGSGVNASFGVPGPQAPTPSLALRSYPGGFLIQSQPIGSLYSFTNGVPVLDFSAGPGSLVLENGGLTQSLTNTVSLDSANHFTSPNPRLSLTLSPSTGLLRGSLYDTTVARKTIPLNGVVLQKQNLASGYFFFTNQIGRVLLLP